MKNAILAVSLMGLLFLGSCSENLLTNPAALSFYSGETQETTAASISMQSIGAETLLNTNCIESIVYIDKVEISQTGEEWINVLTEPKEVRVKRGELIRFANPVTVPAGEYHGVRLTVQAKVRFLEIEVGTGTVNVDVSLEKMPVHMSIGPSRGSRMTITPTTTPTLTSANGALIPFTAGSGKNTYLVFDIVTNWYDDITNWRYYIYVRGTNFLY